MDSGDDNEDLYQTIGDEDASPRIYATEEERYEAYLEFQQEQSKMLERQNEVDAQHAEEYERMRILEAEVDNKI